MGQFDNMDFARGINMGNGSECLRWQAELENKLRQHGSGEAQVPYGEIALAFPSDYPHPQTFEHSIIDDRALISWAAEQGWRVRLAPEVNRLFPPVVFSRID